MTKEKDPVKKYLSSLGKKSWAKQKDKKDSEYMRELQRKSVEARNTKKACVIANSLL